MMLLAPSDIHFVRDCRLAEGALAGSGQQTSQLLTVADKLPKIQVASKDGAWFALNSSCLHVLRQLEKQGKCLRIQVDVVPLSKVPILVQKEMVVEPDGIGSNEGGDTVDVSPSDGETQTSKDTSRVTKRGYQKVPIGAEEAVPAERDAEEEVASTSQGSSASEESDDEDDEEPEDEDALACNVCDRTFNTAKQLALHQQRRRHFGCSVCDSLFPHLSALEQHKESLDHWTDDDGDTQDSESCDESDEDDEKEKPEELERLL